jgi:hypothetical protein
MNYERTDMNNMEIPPYLSLRTHAGTHRYCAPEGRWALVVFRLDHGRLLPGVMPLAGESKNVQLYDTLRR